MSRARDLADGTFSEVLIGGQTGTLQLGNDGTYYSDIEWEYANSELAFTSNNVANFTFNSNGSERLRIQSGGGISFNGDTAAANALDSYEEGSWTPADASGAGLSVTVNSASYVKIGRAVTVTFDIQYPTTSNTTGASLSGLPFTVSDDGAGFASAGYDTTRSYTSANKWWLGTGSTTMYAYGSLNSNLSGGRMIGSGFYYTAS